MRPYFYTMSVNLVSDDFPFSPLWQGFDLQHEELILSLPWM